MEKGFIAFERAKVVDFAGVQKQISSGEVHRSQTLNVALGAVKIQWSQTGTAVKSLSHQDRNCFRQSTQADENGYLEENFISLVSGAGYLGKGTY